MSIRKSILMFVGIGAVISLCLIGYLFFDETAWFNQPCRPIPYKGGSETLRWYQAEYEETKDSVNTVALFYREQLMSEPGLQEYGFNGDHGIWTEQSFSEDGFIFRCIDKRGGILIRGCIYIYKTENASIIERIMYRSTEGLADCRTSLKPS